jgi:hypothetical protein
MKNPAFLARNQLLMRHCTVHTAPHLHNGGRRAGLRKTKRYLGSAVAQLKTSPSVVSI